MIKDPKLIRRYEPIFWFTFIALTAMVGCPAI
jgi:hypothetical protein